MAKKHAKKKHPKKHAAKKKHPKKSKKKHVHHARFRVSKTNGKTKVEIVR